MDFLYSITLLASLAAGALGQFAGLVALTRTWPPVFRDPEGSLTQRLCLTANAGALAAVAFGIASIGVHMAFGHTPGSAESLGPIAFFAVHPAYLGTMAMAAMAALLSHLTRIRLPQRTEDSCS